MERMNIPRILYRISQSTVLLMVFGWGAVVYTALFLKGGHPPLSAIVGMAVIVASWVLGSIGMLCGLGALRGSPKSWARGVVVLLNAALLTFSVVVLYM